MILNVRVIGFLEILKIAYLLAFEIECAGWADCEIDLFDLVSAVVSVASDDCRPFVEGFQFLV